MPTTFDKPEGGLAKKFTHDEELKFQVRRPPPTSYWECVEELVAQAFVQIKASN